MSYRITRDADADFIVSVLDLFAGEMTLQDVMKAEIATLRELCDARTRLLDEKEKAKKKAIEQAQRPMNTFEDALKSVENDKKRF